MGSNMLSSHSSEQPRNPYSSFPSKSLRTGYGDIVNLMAPLSTVARTGTCYLPRTSVFSAIASVQNMQLEPAPVDAGQLGALLESLAADETDETDETRRRRRARSESELSTIPELTPAEVLKAGLDSLQSLVQDGGRPAFPADLAEQVYHDPSKFLDMVRPWIAHPDWVDLPYEADIYGAQLCRWKEFREWQRNIRGLPAAENSDTIPEGPKKDFSKYAARVERHLKQRGFIQPFSLDQDLRQGMWETWVEYLYYES
ncbi:hypothetical protein RB598_000165 [Gaeumannomyces tritici]